MTQEFATLSNYDKLIKTAETLRYSQGFYSRLYETLLEFSEDEIDMINDDEQFKNCKDILDVVMELEG